MYCLNRYPNIRVFIWPYLWNQISLIFLTKTNQWLLVTLRTTSIFFPWLIETNMIWAVSTSDPLSQSSWLSWSFANKLQKNGFSLSTFSALSALFADMISAHSFILFKPLLQCHLFRDTFTNHSIWNRSHS